MSLSKRYITLAVMIACFQALFFVPLITAPDAMTLGATTDIANMLLGVSPFLLHYQSIGLIPIVLAGLSVSMIPLVDKNIDKKSIFAYKTHLTYLFGAVVSIGMLIRSSLTLSEWQFYAVLLEMMMSLQIIIMIINTVEKLKVASSPVLVFFAWNIFIVILRDIYTQLVSADSEQWLLVLFSFAMIVFSVFIAQHFLQAKRNLQIAYISPVRGYQIVDPIKLKAPQVSIMPVVVASMGLGAISSYFIEPVQGVMILSHPVYFVVFAVALFGMTSIFTKDKAKPAIWFSHIETMGGKVVKDNLVQKDTMSAIHKWVKCRIWEQWLVLMLFLIAADFFNLWLMSSNLPPVSYIAGLGIWLLVNAYFDMTKQYDKLLFTYFR